jgi:hypothetical protein
LQQPQRFGSADFPHELPSNELFEPSPVLYILNIDDPEIKIKQEK